MKTKLTATCLIIGSALFASGAMAQDTTTPPDVNTDPGAIVELRAQFREQRREMLQDCIQARRELRERLQNASEEERAAILAEFREVYRERFQQARELRREYRTQVHEIRQERRRLHAGG